MSLRGELSIFNATIEFAAASYEVAAFSSPVYTPHNQVKHRKAHYLVLQKASKNFMKICDASHFFIKIVNTQHEVSSQRYCQQALRTEERSDALSVKN